MVAGDRRVTGEGGSRVESCGWPWTMPMATARLSHSEPAPREGGALSAGM
jgi:hypothetical protein